MAKKNANVIVEKLSEIEVKPLEQVADSAPAGVVSTPIADESDDEEEVPDREFTLEDHKLLTDVIRQSVADKHIKVSWAKSVVSAKKSPTGKKGEKYYIRMEAQDAMGLRDLFDGKINAMTPAEEIPEDTPKDKKDSLLAKGACDYANYGYDLERRAQVRQQLMSELEGPEKVIKKGVISLLAAGYGADEVRTMMLASPKYKDQDGLAQIVDGAIKSANA